MKIAFVGDVMLGRLVNEFLKSAPPEYPWGNTLPVLRQADLRICNLECAVSDFGKPWTSKVFYFKTDSKNGEVLSRAGMDFVSLANNHALDFGYAALKDAINTLKGLNISFAGAGMGQSEASAPAVKNANGLKVSFIAFTDNEPGWEVEENLPGVNFTPINLGDKRAQKLLSSIKGAKKNSDLVIVSAHWGPNWGIYPSPKHIPFAHALVDAGADIVFGHSAHVFQGIEIYETRRAATNGAHANEIVRSPIIYSAGDFIDDYAIDEIERNDQSFIFLIETEGNKIKKLKLYPTVIRDFQACLADPREAEEIVKKMQKLCREFKTGTFWESSSGFLEILI